MADSSSAAAVTTRVPAMGPAEPLACGQRLGEDRGRTFAHDPRVDGLAFLEALADLLAGDEDRLFVGVVFHQVDPANRLVERGEPDAQGTDLQIAGQVVEDLLGVEVAPDGRAVVVGASACLRPMMMSVKPKFWR